MLHRKFPCAIKPLSSAKRTSDLSLATHARKCRNATGRHCQDDAHQIGSGSQPWQRSGKFLMNLSTQKHHQRCREAVEEDQEQQFSLRIQREDDAREEHDTTSRLAEAK